MTHKDIAACLLRGCPQAQHCIKAQEINKRYAWKPNENARGEPWGKQALECTASLHPALRRYNGVRVETTDEDGYKERWWLVQTAWWRPTHVLYKSNRSQHGDPAYCWINEDGTNFRTVSTNQKYRR